MSQQKLTSAEWAACLLVFAITVGAGMSLTFGSRGAHWEKPWRSTQELEEIKNAH